jgi:hypothetical protein
MLTIFNKEREIVARMAKVAEADASVDIQAIIAELQKENSSGSLTSTSTSGSSSSSSSSSM